MKLGTALAILVLFAQQASAESMLWMQPDYEEGDTWEYRVISVEVAPGWHPLKQLWQVGEKRGAVVEPLVSMTVEARTTRDGVVSEVSEEHVYVDEPSLSVGLVVGCVALALRASRPRASQKCRSRNS